MKGESADDSKEGAVLDEPEPTAGGGRAPVDVDVEVDVEPGGGGVAVAEDPEEAQDGGGRQRHRRRQRNKHRWRSPHPSRRALTASAAAASAPAAEGLQGPEAKATVRRPCARFGETGEGLLGMLLPVPSSSRHLGGGRRRPSHRRWRRGVAVAGAVVALLLSLRGLVGLRATMREEEEGRVAGVAHSGRIQAAVGAEAKAAPPPPPPPPDHIRGTAAATAAAASNDGGGEEKAPRRANVAESPRGRPRQRQGRQGPPVPGGLPSSPPKKKELLADDDAIRTRPPPSVPLLPAVAAANATTTVAKTRHELAAQARHSCIRAIRETHRRVLGDLLRRQLGLSPPEEEKKVGADASGGGNSSVRSRPLEVSDAAKAKILLVDPAYHRNVGDHMITLGELELVRSLHQEMTGRGDEGSDEQQQDEPGLGGERKIGVDQCGYVQSGYFAEPCDEYLNRTTHERTTTKSSASSSRDEESSKLTTDRRVALWHGGGNWGDLWRTLHPARIRSFEALLRNRYNVVGMPQSLYYRDARRAEDDARLLWDSIARGLLQQSGGWNASAPSANATQLQSTALLVQEAKSRVFLCWREVESLRQAEQLYPFVTNLLVPDIAFQLGPYERPEATTPTLDLVLLLRDDHESTQRVYRNKAEVRRLLSATPGAERLSFRVVDWDDRLELFDSDNIFFSETSIQLLSMGRVVICDRLHAAILCYLSGIPFVYLDQVSGKITKSLHVAFESTPICRDPETALWSRADNFTHALETAAGFLTKYRRR